MCPTQNPRRDCLHRLVEAAAERTPEAIAIVDGERRITYRELDTQAVRVAQHLRAQGVGAEVIVAILMERSAEMIIALLGILKAGGAYLPLDPNNPEERLRFMLGDANAAFVLTQKSFDARLAAATARRVFIDDCLAAPAPHGPMLARSSMSDLAYVIYTSGSTGQPKGVAVTHANAAWLLDAMDEHFDLDANDVWTFFHSIAFDFSVWEIWGALAHGARVVVVPYATSRSPDAFHDLLIKEGVTILNQTPSAFRQFMSADQTKAQRLTALRYVIFGGEALEARGLRPWFDRHGDEQPRLVNMYGITETTVFVTHRPVSIADYATGPVIGRPLRGSRVLLLDAEMQPSPDGEIGEMWISGNGVARGYLDRPDLNAERFVPDPGQPGGLLYKSGDLARQLPNGELEYLGRADQQVKLSGFRVELGEIEARLLELAGVSQCAVILREDKAGEPRLAAYVVASEGRHFDASSAQVALKQNLPGYMVPSCFVSLPELPLTSNGKLDRQALPAPTIQPPATFFAGTLEQRIASVWKSALCSDQIGLDENFFDLGGHSLLLVQVQTELNRALGLDLPITTLFQNPTVRLLAQHLSPRAGTSVAAQTIRDRAGRQRAAFAAVRQSRDLRVHTP